MIMLSMTNPLYVHSPRPRSAIKYVSYDEAMADVKRNVLLDASEPDARIRVIMLQASYIELCD